MALAAKLTEYLGILFYKPYLGGQQCLLNKVKWQNGPVLINV